jgi:hypothetical protein
MRTLWRIYVCALAACVIAATGEGCDGGAPVEIARTA